MTEHVPMVWASAKFADGSGAVDVQRWVLHGDGRWISLDEAHTADVDELRPVDLDQYDVIRNLTRAQAALQAEP
jgi:hypothetical protein